MLFTDEIKDEIISCFKLNAMSQLSGYCIIDYFDKKSINTVCDDVYMWLLQCGFKKCGSNL